MEQLHGSNSSIEQAALCCQNWLLSVDSSHCSCRVFQNVAFSADGRVLYAVGLTRRH